VKPAAVRGFVRFYPAALSRKKKGRIAVGKEKKRVGLLNVFGRWKKTSVVGGKIGGHVGPVRASTCNRLGDEKARASAGVEKHSLAQPRAGDESDCARCLHVESCVDHHDPSLKLLGAWPRKIAGFALKKKRF